MQQGNRQQAQTETHEILAEHQETLLYCESDQAREQVAQRGGGGVSIHGDLQHLAGHCPGQPAPLDPAWTGGLAERSQEVNSSISFSVF